jgi:hypothetical protein
MGTEKCPFCGQEVDAAATRCFFCGAELNEESVHKRLEQLHKQDARLDRRIHRPVAAGVIFVIVMISILFFYEMSGKRRISAIDNTDKSSMVRLRAEVTFPGARFIITNNDSFDWKNVKLEIMPESTKEWFSLRVPNISAGQTYTAAATKFSKEDGARFNPNILRPKEFWILCDTPTSKRGSYQVTCK